MDKADRHEIACILMRTPMSPLGHVDIDQALDEIERFLTERGYIRADKIIGMKEAGELTGAPLSTLASRTWRRTPGWPAPVRVVASGPLFDADAVMSANVDPHGRSARSRDGRTVTA